MRLLRIPLIVFFLLASAIAAAFIARVTGLWPTDEATKQIVPRTKMP